MLKAFALNQLLQMWPSPSLKHRQRAPDFYVNFSQAPLPQTWTALSLSAAATKPHVPNLSHLRRPPRCQHSFVEPPGSPQPPAAPSFAASRIRGSIPTDLRPRAVGGKRQPAASARIRGPGEVPVAQGCLIPSSHQLGSSRGKETKGSTRGMLGLN